MAQRLHPVSIAAPGFFGINKQQTGDTLDIRWASDATNCVIDQSGRLAARKGWNALTTSPISGTPDIQAIFEYIDKAGVATIISAASAKIYKGTTTLTDITGSIDTPTSDSWQFTNFNGKVVGFQGGHYPISYAGTGSFAPVQQSISDWAASTAYVVGNVVKDTAGTETIYFHCTTAGTSDSSEPTWDTTAGNTTADNSVTWTTRDMPNGNAGLAAFGRIWMVKSESEKNVLQYSDLLIESKFSGGSAGQIDLTTVWAYGMDEIVAIGEFNNFLIIYGKKSIVLYNGADDPSTMALQDIITGIGCIARDSLQDVGTDLLFLSDSGIRSLGRTIQEKSAPIKDISKNVRDYMFSFYENETPNLIKSVYYEKEGFYLITFPTLGSSFVFDIRFPNPDRSLKITQWRKIDPKSLIATRDQKLYMGQAGVVSQYTGYTDNGSTYVMLYRSAWIDFGEEVADRIKIPKNILMTLFGGTGYTFTFFWGYDYVDAILTSQSGVTAGAPGQEWNIGEWNIMEWGGTDSYGTAESELTGDGKVFKFGFNVDINGQQMGIQKIDLFGKLGRL